MQGAVVFRTLGVFLMLFSLSMLPPFAIALWYGDGAWKAFLAGFIATILTGFVAWLPYARQKIELKIRDGFIVVVLFWTVLSVFGALPLMLAEHPHLSLTDAVFEATSGLTTTGATVLDGIDYLPHAIKFYRQQLQFLGGMGIVVLAVAILPMLGVGGLQLYQAEVPGPAKDNKLTPRITQTAKALWYIYVGMTLVCMLCYWLAGMSLFDAIGESFSTISTGGFAMHDASFGFYNSEVINMVGAIFLILSGANFSLHFVTLQRKSLMHYWADDEFKTYLGVLFLATIITLVILLAGHVYSHSSAALGQTIFNVVSIFTTTGLTSAPVQSWPLFIPVMLMIGAMVGGCASSTTGGIKTMRMVLLYKQGMREIHRLIHPQAVIPIKFGNRTLSDQLMQVVWGFFAVYLTVFVFLILVLLAAGLDLQSAFGALVACLANVGVAIGDAANGFAGLNTTVKWTLVFAMIAGRLEIFTLLVLFTPAFWRS